MGSLNRVGFCCRGWGGWAGRKPPRGRRGFLHGVGDLVGNLPRGLLEFLNARAQTLGEFRELLGAKQDQNQSQNEDDLPTAEVKQAKHYIHT